jgi:hypothetical protein
MSPGKIRRRDLLATTGLAAVALAGCSSGGGDDTAEETDESPGGGTETATATPGGTPIEADGLRLWLTPESVTTDGETVATWRDESGNGNDLEQNEAASRPAYRSGAAAGNGAVRFDGEDDFLLRDDALGIANDSARTMVVVARLTDTSARSPFLMQGAFGSSGAGSQYYGLEANTYNTAGERFGLYLVSVGQDSERSVDTSYHVHTVRTSDFTDLSTIESTTDYYVDGAGTTFEPTPDNARNQSFAADSTAVGAFPTSDPGSLMHGEIAEVAVYDRALDGERRAAVEATLLEKYGLGGTN